MIDLAIPARQIAKVHPTPEPKGRLVAKLSFEALATAEPRLLDLEDAVRALCADGRMQDPGIDEVIWSARPNGLKCLLEKLVGWHAENPAIRTEAHWNAAVKHMSGLLEEIHSIASGQLDPHALRPRTQTDLSHRRSEEAVRLLAEAFMEPSRPSPESTRYMADFMPEYLESLRSCIKP